MNNVLCMKWGHAYSARDVNVLYAMVRRHTHHPLRFICLTDDPTGIDPRVEVRELPTLDVPATHAHQPWLKLAAPSAVRDLEGDVLFLDLDIVVRDSIDVFFTFEPGRFCIIHDWSHPERREGNSSVYRFPAKSLTHLVAAFERQGRRIVETYPNEQVWLTRQAETCFRTIAFWPDPWCVSFKRHCLGNRLQALIRPAREPLAAKIIVFHGHPKPGEAIRGEWKGRLKFMHPTPWIEAHWRL